MENLALYLLKSALCIAVFFGIYSCFFKKETFFRFNRHFLIAGIICAIVFPLYTYTYEVTLNSAADQNFNPLEVKGFKQPNGYDMVYFAGLVYALVVCFLLLRHLPGLIRIRKVVGRSGYRSIKQGRLVITSEFKSSFSAFNYIFFDPSADLSETEKKMVLKHELAHVKQLHWIDLLLAQLFCTLQWFNPIAWLYLKAIRQNHEFLADEAVLQRGNSAAKYRAVLVNHFVGTRIFSISSAFNQYPQQRIKMLAKPSSGWINKMAVIMVLPAMALFFWSFSEAKVSLKTPPAVKITVKRSLNARAINPTPLYFLNGVETTSNINDIDKNTIESINVLKGEKAVDLYGERGRSGVILIITKK